MLTTKSIPDYWITSNSAVKEFLSSKVKKGKVFVAGQSAGSRDILAYEYGEKEPLETTTSLSSACASGHPEVFIQPTVRKKPVLMIYSTIHGAEFEGCAALINLINIIENACDLRGRKWPELYDAINNYRLIIVPLAQPDGRERVTLNSLVMEPLDVFKKYAHGVWQDGLFIEYPKHKTFLPLPKDKVKFLGGYFNDNYVNVQHDDFFGDIQPETKCLIDLARSELPDCILSCHSCEADPGFIGSDAYISNNCQGLQNQIAGMITMAQLDAGLRIFPRPNIAKFNYFYLQNILHMATGALPLLYEFPHGVEDVPFSHEEIIDIGLTLFDKLIQYGAYYKFQPRFDNIFLPEYHKNQSKYIQEVINDIVKKQKNC